MTTHDKGTEWTAVPPQITIFQMVTGYYLSQALYVAAKLRLADLLADGPGNYSDLAKSTSTHPDSLNRVMRLLASAGVLTELENGYFALTPIGECLRSGEGWATRSATLMWGGMMQQVWTELLYSVQTGKPATDRVFGTDAWSYLAQHPEEAAIFDESQAEFAKQAATIVAAAYDFSHIHTLVDVGGGNGALLIGILKANPTLHGVVFDLPRTVEAAKKQAEAAGLVGRCKVIGGDFFESVPAGADAYLLKHVIHDFEENHAVAILKNCRRAMAPQGRLLIVEGVYPTRIDQSWESRAAAANDVNLLVCLGGRQRSEIEFRAIFDAAGYRLARIVPTMLPFCLIEGQPA
jgi:SAM-dependent methyltransferase